jgi:hypothetical protein
MTTNELTLNEILTALGYRTEPVRLANGDLRHGRKHIFCGDHRIMENAHASEVWAWLAVTYPDVPRDRLFVAETCHDGGDMCVRRATLEEITTEIVEGEGWAMPYREAVVVAKRSAREMKCRWFDFSSDPAPEARS